MAESGAAQNKLGELFVDIGVGGAGKTIKTLNSISASFLMTKNAAVQLAKPIINVGKQAMNSAVDIGKLGASFGTTLLEAQKFTYYLKEHNLSTGLLNNISGIQDKLTRAKLGYGSLDGQMLMSMNRLGLDWMKYDGSTQSMLQYVKDVQTALAQSGMSIQEQKMHLQNLGLSDSDWLYAFQRGDFDLSKATGISDEYIQSLIDTQEAFNKLGNTFDAFKKKATAKVFEKGGETAIKKSLNVAEDLLDSNSNISKDITNWGFDLSRFNYIKNPKNLGKNLFEFNPISTSIKGGKLIRDLYDSYNKPANDLLNYNSLPNPLDVSTKDISYSINITNENNITGNNAQEIADKIASINSQDIQMTQFQVHNMAGV